MTSSEAEACDRVIHRAILAAVDVLARRGVPEEQVEAAFMGGDEEEYDPMVLFQRLCSLAEWHGKQQDKTGLRV